MIWGENEILLDGGRKCDAPHMVIGLSADAKEMFVGYEAPLVTTDGDPLTDDEKLEVAAHQIRRWQEFATHVKRRKGDGGQDGAASPE